MARIPDSMSLEEAALIEPLAVGVRAVARAGVTLGSDVLICAAGAIGLSSLLAAKSVGASRVCVTGKRHILTRCSQYMYMCPVLQVTYADIC